MMSTLKKFLILVSLFASFSSATWASTSLEDFLFPANPQNSSPHTDAIYVWKEGKVLLERYGNSYTAESPHLLWSASKSVSATILGASIQKGVSGLKDSICKNAPQSASSALCLATLENLLTWSSGAQWNESYENGDPTKSSVVQMLAGDGHINMFNFFLSHNTVAAPGTHFVYSTGDSTALMGALRGEWMAKNLNPDTYPWEILFNPLKMTHTAFEQDPAGNFIGGAFGYMSTLDLAQIGRLYLQNGKWEGKQILPADWRAYVTSPNLAASKEESDPTKVNEIPLHSWWRPSIALRNEGVPADTFMAIGHWGQFLVIIPSLQLVAVRFGDDRDSAFDINQMLKGIIDLATSNHRISKQSGEKRADSSSTGNLSNKITDQFPAYKTGLFSLGTHNVAQIVCACIFVSKQPEDYCKEYGRTSPNVVKAKIDYASKTVEATVALSNKAKAVFVSDALGCRLEN